MRISDWSSDVCSSDRSIDVARVKERAGLANLVTQRIALLHPDDQDKVYDDLFAAYDDALVRRELSGEGSANIRNRDWRARTAEAESDWGNRKGVEEGKRVAGGVDLGARRTIKK